MNEKQFIIITDEDAIVALANENDSNHKKAKEISVKLDVLNAKVMVPVTALSEALTALKRKLDRVDLVKDIVDQCKSNQIPTIGISEDIIPPAISFFEIDFSKKDTFFDAVIAAMAQKYSADAIFSFDTWYRKKGFKLTEDLILK